MLATEATKKTQNLTLSAVIICNFQCSHLTFSRHMSTNLIHVTFENAVHDYIISMTKSIYIMALKRRYRYTSYKYS